VVFLALAGITEAADAVVGLQPEFLLQGVDEHAEHVQQHALATFLNDLEYLHIDQGCEYDGLVSVHDTRVVDLTHSLVCFVHRIDEGQPNVPSLGFELGKDRVAEGLCCNAGAIGNKEYGALGHGRE